MSELNHLSQYATQETNDANQDTRILSYDPEDGTVLQIRNHVAKGSEDEGIPVYMKLRSAAGTPLPTDTEVIFRVDVPKREDPIVVSEKLENIAQWNSIDLGDQRNAENIDAVKVDLKGLISVRHFDTFEVYVVSSAVIDWTFSEFYLDGKATRTVPYRG